MKESIKLVHPFEIANLGKAPFKFVGYYSDVGPKKLADGSEVGSPGQPMGSCDYCGTGIAHCMKIKSSDGKTFIVGSSCVEKTVHKGSPVYTAVQREMRKVKAAQVDARNKIKIAQVRTWLETQEIKDLLNGLNHPQQWRKDLGETRLDWAIWMMANAGTTGRVKVFSAIKKALKAAQVAA